MILMAVRASFVLTIGHSLSNSQVLILVQSLLSSIMVRPHIATMMSWSVGTSETAVTNRKWIIKVSFNRIGNTVLNCIPVTFVTFSLWNLMNDPSYLPLSVSSLLRKLPIVETDHQWTKWHSATYLTEQTRKSSHVLHLNSRTHK